MKKFIYLLSCKLSILYRIYHDNIEEGLDVLVKENKKCVFRNSCLNYNLNVNFNLCFCKIKKEKKLNYSKEDLIINIL